MTQNEILFPLRRVMFLALLLMAVFAVVAFHEKAMAQSQQQGGQAQDDKKFLPRWAMNLQSTDGYFDLTAEELQPIYVDIGKLNKFYDQSSAKAHDISFFPDMRTRQLYEAVPYNDERGQPIPKEDWVSRVVMEVKYQLNRNSNLAQIRNAPVNDVLNQYIKDKTGVIFLRTSKTPFFDQVANMCLIAYDARLDTHWEMRKAFFGDAKEMAGDAGLYEKVSPEAWRDFIQNLRASMCVDENVVKWLLEPPSLKLDAEKAKHKNLAFTYMFSYAALATARDGYPEVLDHLAQFFTKMQKSATPVFGMKIVSVDIHSSGTKTQMSNEIAYPFLPAEILNELKEMKSSDVQTLQTPQDMSDAVLRRVIKMNVDSNDLMTRWLTEEYKSYRIGF